MGLIILLILALGYCYGLMLWFKKAGTTGWHAFVPYLRIKQWVALTDKPKSFIFWSFVPIVNLFIYANLLGETSDTYRRYSFWEHSLATILGFVWLPFLGHKEGEKYHGPKGANNDYQPPKKTIVREWTDAIIFALFAAYFIRTFVFEIYMIPTSSMEGTLRVGDFLVVSKFHYGSRIPNTPLAFPLVHHTFPKWIPFVGGKKSYLEWIKLDYKRLPKLQSVKRNDMVVFNFPANDTTTREYDSAKPYYDLVREAEYFGIENPKAYIKSQFTILTRPVDKRENYIKRCVGIPGDTLAIKSGILMVNGATAYQPENLQFRYIVETDGTPLDIGTLAKLDITEVEPLVDVKNTYEIYTTSWQAKELEQLGFVNKVMLFMHNDPDYDYEAAEFTYYPYSTKFDWNVDNYGPIAIPYKGMTVPLNVNNYLLYKRCIEVYEGNSLTIKNKKAVLNGEEVDSYTFKMDYYWMMGDNRHRSQDSRFWGFVPEDHIVGKAWFLVTSFAANKPLTKKIRWNRTFKSIHGKWAPKEDKFTD